ncbi:MAG: hypothetical protein AB1735_08005 [Pseudomonadota bacterium]
MKLRSETPSIIRKPIKRQFGCVKVRCKGLAKNAVKLMMLFALTNLWLARIAKRRPTGGRAVSASTAP